MNQKLTAIVAAVFLIGAVAALLGLFGDDNEPDPIASGNRSGLVPAVPGGNTANTVNGSDVTPVEPGVPIPPTHTDPPVEVSPPVAPAETDGYSDKERAALGRIEELLAKIAALQNKQPLPGPDYFEQLQRFQEEIAALVAELVALGPDAVKPLLDILDNRGFATDILLKALVGIGGEDVRDGLLTVFNGDADHRLQQDIIRALASWEGEIFPAFEQAFASAGDVRVQMEILRQMTERGEGDVGRFLASAVNSDADRNVRLEAVRSLKRTRDPMAYDLLENLAISESEELALRQQAIYAAAATDALRARSTLEDLAEDNDVLSIRASAIFALSEYYGEEAIPTLELLAANDADQEIRDRAARAIKVIKNRAKDGIPVPGQIDREVENRGLDIP